MIISIMTMCVEVGFDDNCSRRVVGIDEKVSSVRSANCAAS